MALSDYNYRILNAGSGLLNEGSSPQARMALLCSWDDASNLSKAMRGWVKSEGNWVTACPMRHPVEPMYCTDTAVRPLGKPVGRNKWTKAIIDAVFRPVVLNPGQTSGSETELVEESLDFSAEMVDLGSKNWTYDGTTEAVEKPITKLVPMIAYSVTVYHATTLSLTTMYGLLGKLNNATFRGAGAGYMLYCGASASRKVVGQNGTTWILDWTIQHKFLYANRDLNKEWRSSTAAFEKIVSASGATKFESGDFSTLNIGT